VTAIGMPGVSTAREVVESLVGADPQRLRRRAISLRVPLSDADDVAQAAAERALAASTQLRSVEQASVCGWIDMIIRNVATDHLRSPRLLPLDEQWHEATVPGADAVFEKLAWLRQLEWNLWQLEPLHREVLALRAQGHSTAEIAAHLNITGATARQRLHRARKALQEVRSHKACD